MAKIQRSWVVVIAIVAGLADVAITHRVMAATVEEIALMNRADRQKVLVEGAKKEGKVSWYTTLIGRLLLRQGQCRTALSRPF